MPEGDTIHRTAARLRPALDNQTLRRFDAPRLVGDRPKAGDTIEGVSAVGKNLLIRFADDLVLRTHMKMTGSWHLYRTRERWREPAHLARCIVEVDGWKAVCFSAPTVQTYYDRPGLTSPIAHLGPDLCLPDVDFTDVAARAATLAPDAGTIAELLLDQRAAAGIGNVFKSEALWACCVSPFEPATAVDPAVIDRLFRTASKQLRSNLSGGRRTTVPGGLAVYGRERQPCRRCSTLIERRKHGDQARATWWCPSCQPAPPVL